MMKSPKESLITFQSVDDIIWCDHSNETFFAVLLKWCYLFSSILRNEMSKCCWILTVATFESKMVKKETHGTSSGL